MMWLVGRRSGALEVLKTTNSGENQGRRRRSRGGGAVMPPSQSGPETGSRRAHDGKSWFCCGGPA